jgi:hypothetical protein
MIGVEPNLVPTRQQCFGSCIEIVKHHGEVPASSSIVAPRNAKTEIPNLP